MTTEIHVENFSNFINGVCILYNILNCDSGDVWYRGINNGENLNLFPGIVWRNLHKHEDSIVGELS